MLAYVLGEAPRLREVPVPEPQPGEARVRVLLAGICGTDLELLAGYRGFHGIPGHEMVGVVEEASEPRWVGRRVVSEINVACHACDWCGEGLLRHCERRRVLGIEGHDGGFAECFVTPIENLHAVPDGVSDEQAVWTEPLAAALGVWDIGISPGDRVLVLGDGRLGALIALGLRLRGARVDIAGRHEPKLARLRSLGFSIVPSEPRPHYPWVVEATGSVDGVEVARAWTRPRGTIVLKSTCHEPAEVQTARIVVDELRLIGSRCGDFAPALDALETQSIPVVNLVSSVHPFLEIERAFQDSRREDVFKVLLDFRSNS